MFLKISLILKIEVFNSFIRASGIKLNFWWKRLWRSKKSLNVILRINNFRDGFKLNIDHFITQPGIYLKNNRDPFFHAINWTKIS